MKSLTTFLVAAPGSAAWLSKNNAVSYHVPLHLRDAHLMSLNARGGGDDDDTESYRSKLEKVYTRHDTSTFDDLIVEDDAILFLRAREEGTSIISDDFLTTSAGIQIGLWSEDGGDICREGQCEVSFY